MKIVKRNRKSDWIKETGGISVKKHHVAGTVVPHFHEYFELELILSGKGTQNLNGIEKPLSRGAFYLLTPTDYHSVNAENEMTVLNISYNGNVLSSEILNRFSKNRESSAMLSEKQTQEAAFLGEALKSECERGDEFSKSLSEKYLEMLAVLLIRNFGAVSAPLHKSRDISAAISYIYGHFTENITLAQVSRLCGYTSNYFSHIFHDTMGTPFSRFISLLRINYAKMLLSTTDKSVTAVAFESGFFSVSNFFKCFKAETGLAPLKYRKKNNGF